MPKPAPLRTFLAREKAAPAGSVAGLGSGDEKVKISDEQQVVDPLLEKARVSGGMTIGASSGAKGARVELPSPVFIWPGKKAPLEGPFLDPDGSVDFGSEEEPEVSTGQLLEEPSLFDLYRERLVQKYNFAEDDPVFALAEIYSEAERRALARNRATESLCARMVGEMENIVSLVGENVARLEASFREVEVLEDSAQDLRGAAETLEAFFVQQQEDTQTRLKALDLLQKDLTRELNYAPRRRISERFLVVWMVLMMLLGIAIGVNLHLVFSR